jgi:hypothetical protein
MTPKGAWFLDVFVSLKFVSFVDRGPLLGPPSTQA